MAEPIGKGRNDARRGGFLSFPWLTAQLSSDADSGANRAYVMAATSEERDFETALESFANTAQRVQYLWIGFLTVMLAFAITTANITHKMLLLQEGVKLPLVDLTIPLEGYAAFGPFLFLILHFYVLAMLIALSRSGKIFEDALTRRKETDEEAERLRARLGNAFFALLISGPRREREGALAALYTLLALTTVALLPVMVLFLFQLMYLPYQSDGITWWHRFAIWIDLVLVWTLWWSYRSHWGEKLRPSTRPAISFVLVLAVTLGGLFFPLAASFPCDGVVFQRFEEDNEDLGVKQGDYVRDWQGNRVLAGFDLSTCSAPDKWLLPLIPSDIMLRSLNRLTDGARSWEETERSYGPYTVLFGIFPNRVILRKQVLVDPNTKKELEAARDTEAQREEAEYDAALERGDRNRKHRDSAVERYTRNFAGRRLRAADFSESDLTLVDFEQAEMQATRMTGAWLSGASFEKALMPNASLLSAHLEHAFFRRAQLPNAVFDDAHLYRASFFYTKLSGALFQLADLEQALFFNSDLRVTNFSAATLNSAKLWYSTLDDAVFQRATLDNAELIEVTLRRGDLKDAKGQGVFVSNTDLQDSNLRGLDFRFSLLKRVNLVGAVLDKELVDFRTISGRTRLAQFQSAPEKTYRLSDIFILDMSYCSYRPLAFLTELRNTSNILGAISAYAFSCPRHSRQVLDSLFYYSPIVLGQLASINIWTQSPQFELEWNKALHPQALYKMTRNLTEAHLPYATIFAEGLYRLYPDSIDQTKSLNDWFEQLCSANDKQSAFKQLFAYDIAVPSPIEYRGGLIWWPRKFSTLFLVPPEVRKKWLDDIKASLGKPRSDTAPCEAARALTDMQMQELERALAAADSYDARRAEENAKREQDATQPKTGP
ncbi:MAG TPA: hypothetical protein DCL54_14695 [Alphaproteobacteria bacterium]|nr:hypothetical protein [Alphaproteobacteria bacterium]HAJ47819.1 hypothetical protein [Alphaproteobacteria bacterium]